MAHTPYRNMSAEPAPVEKTETKAETKAATETTKPAKTRRAKKARK